MDYIGTIYVSSGKIVASDPCYKLDNETVVFNALNGKYNAYIETSDEGGWGIRNKSLIIAHESFNLNKFFKEFDVTFEQCPVDSGTFGFFDKNYFDEYHECELNEDWYQANVVDQVNEDYFITERNMGVWATSGFGDGRYNVETLSDKDGNVYALKVIFINEFYEDDDWDSDWEDDDWDDDDDDFEKGDWEY